MAKKFKCRCARFDNGTCAFTGVLSKSFKKDKEKLKKERTGNKKEVTDRLLASRDLVECPKCGDLKAYAICCNCECIEGSKY